MDRPLPYLIGSKAFMDQDDVGLGDLSSDGNFSIAVYSNVAVFCFFFSPH